MNIIGRKVILRAIEERDLTLIHQWSNAPEINYMLGGWHFPSSSQDQLKWFSNISFNSLNQRFAIDTVEYGTVGMINLVDINWKDRRAFTGIVIGDMNLRGLGLGEDTINTMNKYAFEELGLNRLDSTIISYNTPSINVYTQKCGWKVEGEKKNCYFRKNQWWDEIIIGITKEDYFESINDK